MLLDTATCVLCRSRMWMIVGKLSLMSRAMGQILRKRTR